MGLPAARDTEADLYVGGGPALLPVAFSASATEELAGEEFGFQFAAAADINQSPRQQLFPVVAPHPGKLEHAKDVFSKVMILKKYESGWLLPSYPTRTHPLTQP